MLTVFAFDERDSTQDDDLRAALDQVAEHKLVWIALRDPAEDEVAAVQEAIEFSDEQTYDWSSS